MEYANTVREINAALAANPGLQGQAIELLQLATDKYTKAREEIAGKKDGNDIMSAIAGQFDGALNSLVNFANTGQASISQRRRGPAAGVPPAAAGQVARRARQQHRRRRWWGTHLAGHA